MPMLLSDQAQRARSRLLPLSTATNRQLLSTGHRQCLPLPDQQSSATTTNQHNYMMLSASDSARSNLLATTDQRSQHQSHLMSPPALLYFGPCGETSYLAAAYHQPQMLQAPMMMAPHTSPLQSLLSASTVFMPLLPQISMLQQISMLPPKPEPSGHAYSYGSFRTLAAPHELTAPPPLVPLNTGAYVGTMSLLPHGATHTTGPLSAPPYPRSWSGDLCLLSPQATLLRCGRVQLVPTNPTTQAGQMIMQEVNTRFKLLSLPPDGRLRPQAHNADTVAHSMLSTQLLLQMRIVPRTTVTTPVSWTLHTYVVEPQTLEASVSLCQVLCSFRAGEWGGMCGVLQVSRCRCCGRCSACLHVVDSNIAFGCIVSCHR